MDQQTREYFRDTMMSFETVTFIFSPPLQEGALQMLLGFDDGSKPKDIPDPLDYRLFGGMNPQGGPLLFHDVADAQVRAKIGLETRPGQYSGFRFHEWDDEIAKTVAEIYGHDRFRPPKRVDFCRILVLHPEQMAEIRPQGNCRGTAWLGKEELVGMAKISNFKHLARLVEEAFEVVEIFEDRCAFAKLRMKDPPGFFEIAQEHWAR